MSTSDPPESESPPDSPTYEIPSVHASDSDRESEPRGEKLKIE